VITIRRPNTLNALNDEVYRQLTDHLAAVEADPDVAGAVITGYGKKAFVSGADVGFLAKIETPEQAEATSRSSQASVAAIPRMRKPVVCAVNGIAFGGGVELALACHDRVVKKGAVLGTPEVTLGLIPGCGATQRLPRLVGFPKAAEMLRTARPVKSGEAVAIGLAREEIDGDVVEAAADLVRRAAAGKAELATIPDGPVEAPEALPDVDLGHLSTAVDGILVRAIVDGAALGLEAGLALEAKLFGEVSKTKDFRIGVTNFMKNGPRVKAEFVNE
jgi:enoyl-CoA hydratase/carnithine racemase